MLADTDLAPLDYCPVLILSFWKIQSDIREIRLLLKW